MFLSVVARPFQRPRSLLVGVVHAYATGSAPTTPITLRVRVGRIVGVAVRAFGLQRVSVYERRPVVFPRADRRLGLGDLCPGQPRTTVREQAPYGLGSADDQLVGGVPEVVCPRVGTLVDLPRDPYGRLESFQQNDSLRPRLAEFERWRIDAPVLTAQGICAALAVPETGGPRTCMTIHGRSPVALGMYQMSKRPSDTKASRVEVKQDEANTTTPVKQDLDNPEGSEHGPGE